jgi:hypothetical protein
VLAVGHQIEHDDLHPLPHLCQKIRERAFAEPRARVDLNSESFSGHY